MIMVLGPNPAAIGSDIVPVDAQTLGKWWEEGYVQKKLLSTKDLFSERRQLQ